MENNQDINISAEEIQIKFTQSAIDQLLLIKENDYTVEDLYFRLKIDGKGCSGFDYALGFSDLVDKDLVIDVPNSGEQLQFIMDPFTAYYCKTGVIDFIQDFDENVEGFSFENDAQKSYKGKFFKDETRNPVFK